MTGSTISKFQLPSHRFRFSVWHDLHDPAVSGSDLKAPRIRDGNVNCDTVIINVWTIKTRPLSYIILVPHCYLMTVDVRKTVWA